MTAAYMQILIHLANSSLFLDADPSSVAWTGPPPEIVTVQSLLYASLATSLFAAFLAMVGKQWVNRYFRNHGGSAAEKSRARQHKLDGVERWYFCLVIESLPMMLQLALLLLGCALSLYLRNISHTVAGVILAFTLLGVTSYIFLTLAATLYAHCPYQTPPSIVARAVIGYLTHNDTTLARSLRSLIAFFPSIRDLGQILTGLRSGICNVLKSLSCVPTITEDTEHMPLAVIVASPTRIFGDIFIDWEVCNAEARCISWVLDSITDADVTSSTALFAMDTIWYPEIAGAVSPHILANLFFDCLSDGRVIPSKLDHATSIGMALASVLSVRLSVEPEGNGLDGLREQILSYVHSDSTPQSMFPLVVAALRLVASGFTEAEAFAVSKCYKTVQNRSSTTCIPWLSRVILHVIWRWRCVQGPTGVPRPFAMEMICRAFTTGNDLTPVILKTNRFLVMAISLGLQIDIHDLYPPSNE
jgi:hypothetical protein